MPAPFVRFTPNFDWRNKHQNVRRRAARLYSAWNLWEPGNDPTAQDWRAGLAGLGQIVGEAEASGRRIRPLGGSWSLSDVAASSDFLIDTKSLNMMTVGMSAEHLAPAAKDRAKTLVFAQCGVSILELNRKLEGRGLSLKTSGASTGQTIAGALATGTHGSAKDVGSIQEFVVGLHLVGEGGENVWVERKTTPIASDAFIAFLGATRVLRDDELFRAALVGIGAFGLVHAVALEVEPIYLLERTIRRFDLRDVRHAITTLDVAGLGLPGGADPPFHFEVVINPYATGNGEKGAYVRVMYKRPFVNLPAPQPGGPVVNAAGDDLLGVIGDIGDVLPGLFPVALGHVLDAQLRPIERALGTHGQTFGSTAIRGAGTSLELGVPPAQAEAAVNVIVDVARERPFGGLIALQAGAP